MATDLRVEISQDAGDDDLTVTFKGPPTAVVHALVQGLDVRDLERIKAALDAELHQLRQRSQ